LKVLQEDPNDRVAMMNKGYIYLKERRPDLAQKQFENASQISLDNPLVLMNLGLAYA